MGRSEQDGGFHRQNVYGVWSKTRFADAVVLSGPQKTIYLSGMGAEDEEDGHIHHPGDAYEQSRYAYAKISKILAQHGAGMGDIVKAVAYVSDPRHFVGYGKARMEALGDAPVAAHTGLVVSGFAWPQMLVEIDIVAVVPG